jgi:hypothetical protein
MLELNEFIDAENAVNDAVWAAKDAVDTNTVLFNPSNKSALLAYEAVPTNEPVRPDEKLTLPVNVAEPVTTKLPVISKVSVLEVNKVPDDPVIFTDPETIILFWLIKPFLATNSFAIMLYLDSLSSRCGFIYG